MGIIASSEDTNFKSAGGICIKCHLTFSFQFQAGKRTLAFFMYNAVIRLGH